MELCCCVQKVFAESFDDEESLGGGFRIQSHPNARQNVTYFLRVTFVARTGTGTVGLEDPACAQRANNKVPGGLAAAAQTTLPRTWKSWDSNPIPMSIRRNLLTLRGALTLEPL